MKKALLSFALTTTILGAFTYCSKKEDPAPSSYTPIEQQTTSVSGFINPSNQFGASLGTKSGFVVTLVGTAFVDTTDQYGKFIIKNVKVGGYKLQISKSGFGTYKRDINVNAPGSGTEGYKTGTSSIKQYSTLPLTSVTAFAYVKTCTGAWNTLTGDYFTVNCDTTINVNATVGSISGVSGSFSAGIEAFMDSLSTVNNKAYAFLLKGSSLSYDPATSSFNLNVDAQALKTTYGFKSKQKLFIAIYSTSGSYGEYVNLNDDTNAMEYPLVNPNSYTVVTVIIP